MKKKIAVMFLTAEAAPLVKIGGLGDVGGSLPAALAGLEGAPVDFRLFLPFYPALKEQNLALSPAAVFEVAHTDGPIQAQAYLGKINGVPLYLIDGEPVSSSPSVYSGDNFRDGTKFAFFSLAALELARILDWGPDLLHAQDWHTSPAVYQLSRIRQADAFYGKTRSLLTVHNLPYLGHGAERALIQFGLPPAKGSALPTWAVGLPLPQGLLGADRINTVSPGYAAETLTPEFGAGLEGFLARRGDDLRGILNGLDLKSWDPEADPHLPANFSASSLPARKENKARLQEELGLEIDPALPLLAMINRMDHQKGVDLVPEALRQLEDLGWQAVILGTGDPSLEEEARQLDEESPRVRAVLKYDGALARRIYGGSDLILIPSRYEPCGLTQMIGMRYGCVPLARATGGLKDTIIDYGASREKSTGFLFEEASSAALANCIARALEVYSDQRRWRGLQRRGMKTDFSWTKSANEYLKLYKLLLNIEN